MCAVTKSCQNRLATRQRGIQSLGFVSWLWKSSYIAHSRFRSAKYVKSSSGHRGDAVERLGWQSLLFIVPANKHTHTHVRGAQTTRTESIIEERLSNHGQHEAEAAGSRSGKKKELIMFSTGLNPETHVGWYVRLKRLGQSDQGNCVRQIPFPTTHNPSLETDLICTRVCK